MKKRKPSSRAARSGEKASVKAGTEPKTQVGEDEITRSAAFRRATAEAEAYANDPGRLRKLLLDAREKLNHIPRGPFADTWPYLMAMIRLIRAYHQGEYRDISSQNLFDVIPDSVPVFGHIDDAMVTRLAMKAAGADLDAFMAWETSKI